MNELNKIAQQATNATQKTKKVINKVKEYNQMIFKHYKRTSTITVMVQYSDENWKLFVEKKQWTRNN